MERVSGSNIFKEAAEVIQIGSRALVVRAATRAALPDPHLYLIRNRS